MNQDDKKEIIARYESRLKEFGHDVRALASGSDEKQTKRYLTLMEIGIENQDSVLDLGCGFGDFRSFLIDQGIGCDYTGYDIVPGLIDVARANHPDAVFELRDIQEEKTESAFDWVVSSQAFNNRLKHEDNLDVVKDVMRLSFEACRKGVAFDMMGNYVDFKEDRLYYFSPEKMFTIARDLSPRVVLRHDYLPHEFCIYILKAFTT